MDEQSNTVIALQTAIQMEIDGKEYYLKASQASRNGLGQKLFQTLAGEEDIHRRNFEKIFMAIQSKKQWPQIQFTAHAGRELKTLFAEAMENIKSTGSVPEGGQNATGKEKKTSDLPAESELGAMQTRTAKENKTSDLPADSELGAVQTAMAMENKTRDFYTQQANIASFEAEKKYYSLLAGEESAHHGALLDYYEYLSNPGQYFTLKERQSLDGG